MAAARRLFLLLLPLVTQAFLLPARLPASSGLSTGPSSGSGCASMLMCLRLPFCDTDLNHTCPRTHSAATTGRQAAAAGSRQRPAMVLGGTGLEEAGSLLLQQPEPVAFLGSLLNLAEEVRPIDQSIPRPLSPYC